MLTGHTLSWLRYNTYKMRERGRKSDREREGERGIERKEIESSGSEQKPEKGERGIVRDMDKRRYLYC